MDTSEIKKLITSFKKFNKDDLLIFFVDPEFASQEDVESLKEVITTNFEGCKGLTFLILPKSYDIKKIKFVGVEGKRVKKIDVKDDDVIIEFEEKNENKRIE